jgi:hypothetical protein
MKALGNFEDSYKAGVLHENGDRFSRQLERVLYEGLPCGKEFPGQLDHVSEIRRRSTWQVTANKDRELARVLAG